MTSDVVCTAMIAIFATNKIINTRRSRFALIRDLAHDRPSGLRACARSSSGASASDHVIRSAPVHTDAELAHGANPRPDTAPTLGRARGDVSIATRGRTAGASTGGITGHCVTALTRSLPHLSTLKPRN